MYPPSPKSADSDNWLLDLNLRHLVFATNQAAMVIHELGIDPALESVVNRHIDFFSNKNDRLEPLVPIVSLSMPNLRSKKAQNEKNDSVLGLIGG